MFKFLVRKTIKDYKNINDPIVRSKYGYLGAFYGLTINIFLMLFKIIVGFIFTSIALIADGLNNLSDCLNNFICIFGFRLSKKPADKEHPYGHQKIEYIASLLVSFVIMALALITCYQAGKGLYDFFSANPFTWFEDPYSKTELILTPIVLSLSILLKLSMFRFSYYLAKESKSLSLKAIGKDSLNDVILTSSILVGYIFTAIFHISFENYLAIIVSCFIFYSGIEIFKDSSNQLIGICPSKEIIKQLYDLVKSYDLVLGCHDLELRAYNEVSYYGSIHIEVNEDLSLVTCHDLMDEIEHVVKNKLNIDLVTHMDPISIDNEETNKYKERIDNIIVNYNPKVTYHDFRIVKGTDIVKIIFDSVIDLDKKNKKEKKLEKKLGYVEYMNLQKSMLIDYLDKQYNNIYNQVDENNENSLKELKVEFVINLESKDSYILSNIGE